MDSPVNVNLPSAPTLRRPPNKLPRLNEPCWCGSGKKYKKCHEELDVEFLRNEKARLEAERVRPGRLSVMRPVPSYIAKPDYAFSGTPNRANTRLVRTAEEAGTNAEGVPGGGAGAPRGRGPGSTGAHD